jgi:hypothetical protein
VEQLRDVPPSFFAVRRKKTRLYHHRLPSGSSEPIHAIAEQQLRGRIIAFSNYARITRRTQFAEQIAWAVTKRVAKRSARIYHRRLPPPRLQ